MIDIHCHLNFHSYEHDTDEVIKRALNAGVTKIVNVGTQISSSEHAVKLAEQYEELWAIVGVHPHHADKINSSDSFLLPVGEGLRMRVTGDIFGSEPQTRTDRGAGTETETTPHPNPLPQGAREHFVDNTLDWLEQLENLAKHPKVIGIGEIGMDYYSYASNGVVDPKLQREVFEAQIDLAYTLKLPLQIHHRQVGQELIDILKENKQKLLPVPGMFHCFAGSHEFLKQALDLGFYIGFDGNSTYGGLAKGETVELSEIAKATPIDRIVTETDSPYLAPNPHRGTRNEPAYVILVGEFLAKIKNIPYEELVEQTTANVHTVFTRLK